ncbi:hypothetical protein [Vibrio alfacsensis]|uniref:hypothetical protein n=1 Tax=Vibrio alfacsensis TaxID=1074311 RepID=UPI004069605D
MKTSKHNWEELAKEYEKLCENNKYMNLKFYSELKGISYSTLTKKMRALRQGAPKGSQRALKHGGYANKFYTDQHAEQSERLANATLEDELVVMRVSLSEMLNTLRDVQKKFDIVEALKEKLPIFDSYLAIHNAIDRRIQRIESCTVTLYKLRQEKAADEKRQLEIQRMELLLKKIHHELEKQQLDKEANQPTPLEEIYAELRAMESDGMMNKN